MSTSITKSLTREEVDGALSTLSLLPGAPNNYKLGVLAAFYHMVDDAPTKAELLEAMIYVQTSIASSSLANVSNITKSLSQALGLTTEELQVAKTAVEQTLQNASDRASKETH